MLQSVNLLNNKLSYTEGPVFKQVFRGYLACPQDRTLTGISQYLVYWFFLKSPLEKGLQGFLKLCEGFWIIELDLQQNKKKFLY